MPAVDRSSSGGGGLRDPAEGAVAVTPHNTNELTYTTRGLYVGGAGDLTVLMDSGDVVAFVGVAAGSVLPLRVARVNSTGTTATSIVALY